MFKKIISGIIITLLSINPTNTTINNKFKDKEDTYDIVIGSIKDNKSIKKDDTIHQLDFSSLDLIEANNELTIKINYDKIDKISDTKKLTKHEKLNIINNAKNTKDLLDNKLSSKKIKSELLTIIDSHLKHSGQNPIITMVQITQNKNTPNTVDRIYTSVSGTKSSIWTQTDLYYDIIPTTRYISAASLNWNNPINISNNYDFKYKGTLDPSAIRISTGTTTNLTYKFYPNKISNITISAELLDAKNGNHTLYSEVLKTNNNINLENEGQALSKNPKINSNCITSYVDFTL